MRILDRPDGPDFAANRRTFEVPLGDEPAEVTLVRSPAVDEEAWAARSYFLETWTNHAADVPLEDRPTAVPVDEPFDDVDWTAEPVTEGSASDHWQETSIPADPEAMPAEVADRLDAVTPGDGHHDLADVAREAGETYAVVHPVNHQTVYLRETGRDELADGARGAMNDLHAAVRSGRGAPPTPECVESAIDEAATEMFGEGWGMVAVEPAAGLETSAEPESGIGR